MVVINGNGELCPLPLVVRFNPLGKGVVDNFIGEAFVIPFNGSWFIDELLVVNDNGIIRFADEEVAGDEFLEGGLARDGDDVISTGEIVVDG